jgi:hypothetical protein
VPSNDPNTPTIVALQGTGVAAATPQAALTPAMQDFGSVAANSTVSHSFTLANAGNATLNITSVGVSGTNASLFTIGTNTCGNSLGAAASCTITVSFAPTVAVTASAALSVIDAVGTQTSALTGSSPTVASGDFTLAATPSAQSSYHGASVNFTLSVANANAANPFTGTVILSAANLPAGSTVSFSPATLTPSGVSTMTVRIPALAASTAPPRPFQHVPLQTTLAGLSLAALLLGTRKRRLPMLVVLLLALGGAFAITGCSGAANGFAVPTTTTTLTITGTSGVTVHTTNVTLTIQ